MNRTLPRKLRAGTGRRGARPRTAAARARGLRRRLTALFALTSAVGLVGLAAFAVHNDNASRRRQLDAELRLQATQAASVLGYDDDDRLDVTGLDDYVETTCPTLHVLSAADGGPTPVYTPRKACAHATPGDLRAVAGAAIREGSLVLTDARGTDGRPLRLVADPFGGPGGQDTGGAIVVSADLSADRAAHGELTALLAAGCAVLLTLSAVAGHLLSGRAIRPALTALQQQEAFLADAAHDLRTPAASLRLLAETALRDDAARVAALERTLNLATRMGDLVDGLLTRARLVAGVGTAVREPLRLDQLVETVVDDIDTDIDTDTGTGTGEHRVTVRTEPAVVTGDPDLLRRAVANLLGNALTHGRPPGLPADVRLTVTGDGTVTVDDSGPGVPAELAGSLFERFRSGSGSSGLGLSIASWVAHSHGGSLTVGTSPTGGARFTLRLPAGARAGAGARADKDETAR
ncbi:sensor histidine kinase [Kitasatospora sp. NPDC058048]|uniref:sensor histidine kinase n=1 Tax=Kitasatospora sp. NPDC058048 TaxID=3346313 RepID=UPI0036DABA76